MLKYLFFVSLVISVALCDNPNENKTEIQAKLNTGTIALCGEFIYQLTQSKPKENFVTSPSSVLTALGPLTLYAQCAVLDQLLRLQNLDCKNELKTIYPDIIDNYNDQENIIFEFATKYYANVEYPLTDNFISDSQTYFEAYGENLNFTQNQKAAEIINNWVANHTENKIQNLVSPDMLSADTVLVLVNAIYFLGNWLKQFNPNDTQTLPFTTIDQRVVKLKTMYQENNFYYLEDCDVGVSALKMLYKNYNYSFLVILPNDGVDFCDIVEALRNPITFTNITNNMSMEKVQVYLPQMDINTDMDMGEMLKEDNVTKMFDPNYKYGFKGILQNNDPIYISDVVQKAYVKVTETGTEAAAATAVIGVGATAVMEPPQVYIFNASHPYLFYILFEDVPLFGGAFVGGC